MSEPQVPLLRADVLEGTGCAHGFTTRDGGVSSGSLASLNLARRPGENDAHLAENWRRALGALGGYPVEQLVLLSQVHGADVAVADAPSGWGATVGDYDAAVTTVPGLVLATRSADCVPVLFAGPGVVGVAHAGWRGAAAGVIPATVAALRERTDGPLAAAIGPAISGAAYEVGPEVVAGLAGSGVDPGVFVVDRQGDRSYVDVGAAVEAQLRGCGVTAVERIGRCTWGDPALFSHREDPACGRQAGLIALGS